MFPDLAEARNCKKDSCIYYWKRYAYHPTHRRGAIDARSANWIDLLREVDSFGKAYLSSF